MISLKLFGPPIEKSFRATDERSANRVWRLYAAGLSSVLLRDLCTDNQRY